MACISLHLPQHLENLHSNPGSAHAGVLILQVHCQGLWPGHFHAVLTTSLRGGIAPISQMSRQWPGWDWTSVPTGIRAIFFFFFKSYRLGFN